LLFSFMAKICFYLIFNEKIVRLFKIDLMKCWVNIRVRGEG